jgi:hypothetical protein
VKSTCGNVSEEASLRNAAAAAVAAAAAAVAVAHLHFVPGRQQDRSPM